MFGQLNLIGHKYQRYTFNTRLCFLILDSVDKQELRMRGAERCLTLSLV